MEKSPHTHTHTHTHTSIRTSLQHKLDLESSTKFTSGKIATHTHTHTHKHTHIMKSTKVQTLGADHAIEYLA